MRLLIVTNTYPPADITGVGALAFEMAKFLGREGHGVRVLTREAASDDPYAVGTGGRKVLFPLSAGLRFWRLARRRPFDLVHVHESDGVLVALLLRLLRLLRHPAGRARLVATLQVSYVCERRAVRPIRAGQRIVSRPERGERLFAWVRAPILAFLGRLTARLADAVTAPSRVTAGELEADYGARVAAVIPNGVHPLTGEKSAPPEGIRRPVILYAGRMRTRKAVGVMIEAVPRVLAACPEASFVLAGDGEHRATLEARVRELGVDGSVHFLGPLPRDEMLRWYGAADIFCLPSIYEGLPLVILEAMSAGLPIVSTTVSGIPETVEEGVSGFLVPPEEDDPLAEALIRLATDAELRDRCGQAARQAVLERFDIRHVARSYVELFRKLAAAS